jgi:integrase
MARNYEGIRVRHRATCATHNGGRCKCSPGYMAEVWDAASEQKRRKTFSSLSEAKAWRADANRAVRRGEFRTPSKQTYREAAEAWLEGVKSGTILNRDGRRFKPKVLRLYEQVLEDHVLPVLGHKRLSDVTTYDVQELVIDRLSAEGFSGSTVHNAITALKALCRYLIRRGLLTINPTLNLEMPACNSRRIVKVSQERVRAFLAALPEDLRPLYATAAYGGLRRGEIRGWRWGDVDLANGLIHVRRSMDEKDYVEVDPKTRKGERTAPLFGILRDYLDEYKLSTGGSEDDFVFRSRRGNPFTTSNVRKRAAKACREAGVKCYGLQDLRHAYVSFMVDAGFDLAEIGDYVGHTTVYMVDHYRHLLEGKRQQARERADAYFAGTGTFSGTKAVEEALDPAPGAK